MAHSDDSISLNAETPLKRKAISECRLQDPKIWTKISWIRTNFVKDLESGVRKTDFYNYVTEHLGKTGYRDVWHLLKIAYPHVDRVRRGRKYMYWGVRHADGHAKFDEINDWNNGEDEDDETNIDQDKEFSAEESALKMELEGFPEESGGNKIDELSYPNSQPESKEVLKADTKSGILVKVKKDPDCGDQKQDVVVIEFKDKEVFASFEDYEKSKQTADLNGNLIKTKTKKSRRNKITDENERKNAARSVSPPLEIFSFESLKDDEKNNQILDLVSNSKDHCDEELKSGRVEQEGCHGNRGNGTATLNKSENGSLAENEEVRVPTFGDKGRHEFSQSLLQPENINRMCMPLIKDLASRGNKTRSPNESSVNETAANRQLHTQDNNSASLSIVEIDSNGDNEVGMNGMNGKFPYHPLIVSVASIAGVEESKGSDKASSDEISNILKASQLQSCKSVTARLDVSDGSTRQSPPSQQQSSPDDYDDGAEFVVVQDRGIQVTEKLHTCNSIGKRNSKQIKPVCHKPSHSSQNVHTSKKIPSPNSSIVRSLNPVGPKNSIPITVNKGQGLQNVSSSDRRLHLKTMPSSGLVNRTSTRRSETNNVSGQPIRSMAVPRDSHSKVSKTMGNVVRSKEPLMQALMNKPPSYHALVANKSSPDRVNYTGTHLQTGQKKLLPKRVISPEVINTVNKPHQDRLSPKYSSAQNVVYGKATIEHRPTIVLPHGQQEKRLFDDNVNKSRATAQTSSHERSNEQRSPDESPLKTRDFLRNLLTHHDSNLTSPSTNTSTSDLQVTVECLSSELEKERTMRLRLEIELRKVENQLNEERKLNERLASLLMKR